jgi:hypothetical protein
MKRILPYLLAIILTMIIFSGCKPLFPIDKDQFDLRDTVVVKVGEKVYECEDLWIRLDSITHDDRCCLVCDCYLPGGVNGKFTIGGWDSTLTCEFQTDSMPTMFFMVPNTSPLGGFYNLTVIDVTPGRATPETVISQKDYRVSVVLEGNYMVDKPNIYLYPTKKTRMIVSLDLPEGGKVTESIPEYPKKWKNIRVKPDGTINNKYDFLFYEADLPGDWQFDNGWVVAKKDLKFFFEMNLRDYGFNKKEIKDFTEWWIPRLKDHPYYEIYPQHTAKIESIVPLKINKEFDSLLRLFYFVEGVEAKRDLPDPVVPKFERNGFTVTEWGVSVQ